MAPKPRIFDGNAWQKFKLNLAGSTVDGRENGWNKGVSAILPAALGIVSQIYLGNYATGAAVGKLATSGLDSWASKQLKGTDGYETFKNDSQKGQSIGNIVSGIGGVAASVYEGLGGNGKINNEDGGFFKDGSFLDKTFSDAESKKLLNNVSADSIQKFLDSESGSDVGDSLTSLGSARGSVGDGILALDDKKKTALPSTLPYNMFGQSQYFADGGEPTAAYRDFVAKNVGWNDEKTGFLKNIKVKEDEIPMPVSKTSTGSTAPIEGIAGEAYKYLTLNKGLKDSVAAAFIGNLMQESGLNPTKVHDQGTGFGISGWRDPQPGVGRKTALLNYLRQNGKQQNDLFGQLDFMVDEATQRGDLQRASQFSSPQDASAILSKYYFRPNKRFANNQARASNASNIFKLHGMSMNMANGGELMPIEVEGETFNVDTSNLNYKFYPLDDKQTEDYYMIDKRAGDHFGMSDILSALSWGQGRFGERIFKQKTNELMKAIMNSDKADDDKKRLLGSVVLSDLKSHRDFSGLTFASGGESSPSRSQLLSKKNKTAPKKPGLDDSFIVSTASAADIVAAKKLYNEWAGKKGVFKIPVDSKVTKEVSTAFANYNADQQNLRKISPSGTTVMGKNGNTQYLVQSLGLSPMLGFKVELSDRIGGYDKDGNAVMVPASGTVTTTVDPKTKKLAIVNDEYLGARVPGWNDKGPGVTSTSNVDALDTAAAARKKAFNNASALRSGLAAVETLTGTLLASKPIPTWQPTEEYNKLKAEIYGNKNQGFSAEERAAVNQGLNNNYARGLATVRNMAGGGVNAGAYLGVASNLSQNLDNSYLAAAQQDIALKRQNYNRYQQMVMTDLSLDQQLSQVGINNALETKQNGIAMIQDGTQRLFDESQYRQDYGPDSMYNEFLTAQAQRTRNSNEVARLQAEAFGKQLAGPMTQTTPVAPVNNNPFGPTVIPGSQPLFPTIKY